MISSEENGASTCTSASGKVVRWSGIPVSSRQRLREPAGVPVSALGEHLLERPDVIPPALAAPPRGTPRCWRGSGKGCVQGYSRQGRARSKVLWSPPLGAEHGVVKGADRNRDGIVLPVHLRSGSIT